MRGAFVNLPGCTQVRRFAVLLLIIVSGLTLRRFGYAADLLFLVVKYGGSLLWGAMVYFLLALAVTYISHSKNAVRRNRCLGAGCRHLR